MDRLPNELLLDIFGHLSYLDLNLGVAPSCKLFQGLIAPRTKTGAIDLTLFRDAPSTKLVVGYPIQLHPVFEYLWYSLGAPLDGILLKGPHRLRLIDHPVALENAVSPAANTVRYQLKHHSDRNVRSSTPGGAVTVLDLMRGIFQLLELKLVVPLPRCRTFGEMLGLYSDWKGIRVVRSKDGVVALELNIESRPYSRT